MGEVALALDCDCRMTSSTCRPTSALYNNGPATTVCRSGSTLSPPTTTTTMRNCAHRFGTFDSGFGKRQVCRGRLNLPLVTSPDAVAAFNRLEA